MDIYDIFKENEDLIEKATQKGAIYCVLYFDAYGDSEESVKNLLIDYLNRIINEEGVIIGKGLIDKIEKLDNYFSSYGELVLVVKDLKTLIKLILNYAPIGLEILKPKEINISISDLQSIGLDIIDYVHILAENYMKHILKGEKLERYIKEINKRKEYGKEIKEKSQHQNPEQ